MRQQHLLLIQKGTELISSERILSRFLFSAFLPKNKIVDFDSHLETYKKTKNKKLQSAITLAQTLKTKKS
jgi:hypothetical protein